MLTKPLGQELTGALLEAGSSSQRLQCILIGMENVARPCQFYEAQEWEKPTARSDGLGQFNFGGYSRFLIVREAQALDASPSTQAGTGFANQNARFSGVVLIYLASEVEEVPQIHAKTAAAGRSLVKPATPAATVAGLIDCTGADGHLFAVDYEDAWMFNR